MKRTAILLISAILLFQTPANAAPKVAAGSSCSKAGATQVVSGKKFTCIKSGSKLVWDKGVAGKKSQTLSSAPVSDVDGSVPFFQVNVQASSGLIVQASSNTPQVCDVNLLLIVIIKKIGACELSFTQPGNSTYSAAAPLKIKFKVSKIKQEITVNDDPKLEILDKTQDLRWSASSGLDVILKSLTPNICTVQTETLTLLSLGVCEVQGSQPGNDEYEAANPVTFKYEIVKAEQEIEFDRIDDVSLDEMYVELDAYSNADDKNIKPIFTTSTPKVCVIEDGQVLLLAPGECTVLATHPGTAIYAPAPIVSQTFNVLAAAKGSLENPYLPGEVFAGEEAEITFFEYTEKVDMRAICKENSYIEGCTEDKNYNGIPDPDAETKLVALLFEYKNLENSASLVRFSFSVIFDEEIIDTTFSDVPRDIEGKKLLPNSKAKGYVYVSVPKEFDMKKVVLLFETFDKDYNDVYVALKKP